MQGLHIHAELNVLYQNISIAPQIGVISYQIMFTVFVSTRRNTEQTEQI